MPLRMRCMCRTECMQAELSAPTPEPNFEEFSSRYYCSDDRHDELTFHTSPSRSWVGNVHEVYGCFGRMGNARCWCFGDSVDVLEGRTLLTRVRLGSEGRRTAASKCQGFITRHKPHIVRLTHLQKTLTGRTALGALRCISIDR